MKTYEPLELVDKHSQLADWKVHNKFPLMYREKDGKTRVWACWVIGDTVYRTDGFVDGKLKYPQSHKYDANTLRSGPEQALQEAEKIWLKQFNNEYYPHISDKYGWQIYEHVKDQKERNGGMNRGVKLFGETAITEKTTAGKVNISCHNLMLAKKYKDWTKSGELLLTAPAKNIKFPAILQPKVDGIRMSPQIVGEQVFLQSRNGKYFVHLNHIRDEILYWLNKKGCPELLLDGELYVHCLYKDSNGNPTLDDTDIEMKSVERYQFISEACKITRKEEHPYEHFVEYWIFDICDTQKPNMERFKLLQKLFEDYDGDVLKLVPTYIVEDHDEIEDKMAELIGEYDEREGYKFEGIMVRQADAKYVASKTRPSCLLKFKRFEDDEWEIYGADKTHDGGIIWLCKKEINGIERTVRATHNAESATQKKYYQDYQKCPNKFIGKMINIRFNDKTKDDIPRFPKATAFVEDK